MYRLIVLPGLSSQFEEKYKPVYELIKSESEKKGMECDIVSYPGQCDIDGIIEGELNLKTSVDHVIKIIDEFECQKIKYKILSISYGCNVFLASSTVAKTLKHCISVVLWGPIPHWMVWSNFWKGSSSIKLGFGNNISNDFYLVSQPNEYLIQYCPVDLHVAIGSKDKYVGIDYLNYLMSMPILVENIRCYSYINDCQHNVTRDDQGVNNYLDLIFNDKFKN